MKKYNVPKALLECKKGHLVKLREHLVSIGYPLASNEELNAPDSVLRLAQGYRLVMVEDDNRNDYKTYHIEEYNEDSSY